MKRWIAWVLVIALVLAGCGNSREEAQAEEKPWIFLLGERHSRGTYMEEELAQWQYYYEEYGMRHLFIEFGYCSAQVLNLWMDAEDDAWLELWYENLEGTAAYVPATLDFLRGIKEKCPETVFHGTDVEHQIRNTGEAYIAYLEENGLTETEEYALARECAEQAELYYQNFNYGYREERMVENFIREFDSLEGESIMGIYGSAHTDLDGAAFNYPDIPCVANQLKDRYVGQVVSWDVFSFIKLGQTEVQTIDLGGTEYEARQVSKVSGRAAGTGVNSRTYWLLENPGEDFADWKGTGETLAFADCPVMRIGDVIVLEVEKADGTVEQTVYLCGGETVEGRLAAERIRAD